MQNEISIVSELRPELKALASKRGGAISDRFWRKVYKLEGDNSCWLWIGASNEHHYGVFNYKKRLTKAHRVSWILEHGDIPDGLDVLHKCDVPPCIRPSHLFLGDAKTNGLDAANKHRTKQGENHWNCKLTEQDVLIIRESFTGWNYEVLAERFHVHPEHIRKIVNWKIWKHI